MADSAVFDRIVALLEQGSVEFGVLEHEPVYTSEQAAEVRGTPLSSGAKALICKGSGEFLFFVLPADRRLASKQLRKQLKLKSLRFASKEEVLELTSLLPGSIPPFGSLFGLRTYCDRHLKDEPTINFNAGDHAKSISLSFASYQLVEDPLIGDFAE